MPRTAKKPAERRRAKQAQLVREIEGRVASEPVSHLQVEPVPVLLEVLGRTTARFRAVSAKADEVPIKDYWRDTIAGKVPHEWIVYEDKLRSELAYLTSRMIALEISAKDAQSRERVAEAYAIVIEGIVEGLELTTEQRKLLPSVIRERLPRLLESAA